MKTTTSKVIVTLLIGLAVWCGALFQIYTYFSLPEKHVDAFTGQCVRIVTCKGEVLPCSDTQFKNFLYVKVHKDDE